MFQVERNSRLQETPVRLSRDLSHEHKSLLRGISNGKRHVRIRLSDYGPCFPDL